MVADAPIASSLFCANVKNYKPGRAGSAIQVNPWAVGRLPSGLSSTQPATAVPAFTLLNQADPYPGLVHIRFEEHEDHHTGDRNVEPDRERPAGDPAVHREPSGQREKESREHHRQRDNRKDYVAG